MVTSTQTPRRTRKPRDGATRVRREAPSHRVLGARTVENAVRVINERYDASLDQWVTTDSTVAPSRYQPLTPGAVVRVKALERHTQIKHRGVTPDPVFCAALGEVTSYHSEGIVTSSTGRDVEVRFRRQTQLGNPYRTLAVVVAVNGTAVIVQTVLARGARCYLDDYEDTEPDRYELGAKIVVHKRRLTRADAKLPLLAQVMASPLIVEQRIKFKAQVNSANSRYPVRRLSDVIVQRRDIAVGHFIAKFRATPRLLSSRKDYHQAALAYADGVYALAGRPIRKLSDMESACVFTAHYKAGGAPVEIDAHRNFAFTSEVIEVSEGDCAAGVRLGAYSVQQLGGVVEAMHSDGVRRITARNRAFDWGSEDGGWHAFRRPATIGARHSSKQIVGPVMQHGQSRFKSPTIGIELEMQAIGGHDQREPMARALRAALAPHWGSISPTPMRRYVSFEEDGSTGAGGFEMVTGYGTIELHRRALAHMLKGPDTGRLRWTGKLRSHDAEGQKCGIHVHIQKPQSAVHRWKLHFMVNADWMRPVWKCVARRIDNYFARSEEGYSDVATYIQKVKQYRQRGYNNEQAKDRVDSDLRIDRYRLINFQNSATVEFRAYRGSLRYETVMACIELSLALWRYALEVGCVSLSSGETSQQDFMDWLSQPCEARDTKFLRAMLAAKGFKVRVPEPKKAAAPRSAEVEALEA